MRDTRSEIMSRAVALFNARGFFKVTVKDIADALGISPGNLTYHFKKKEHLLEALQTQMIERARGIIVPADQEITLAHFQQMFERFFEVQQAYRFYFCEIIYLLEEYPEITRAYRETTSSRFEDARKLVDYYIATGRLLPETEERDYDDLIRSLWMVNTFWTLGNVLANDEVGGRYANPIASLWKMLLPYLSEKGRAEYQSIKEEPIYQS